MLHYTVGVNGVDPETEKKLSAFGDVTGSGACLNIYFLSVEPRNAVDTKLNSLREEPYVTRLHTSAIMDILNA